MLWENSMRKTARLLPIIIIAVLMLLLVGCSASSGDDEISITLQCNNGTILEIADVEYGKPIKTPDDPRMENYIFIGWYKDSALTQKYDFSESVTRSFTLYAAYELDAASLTNTIGRAQMRSMLKIENRSYNSFLGIETGYELSQGSGVCIYSLNGFHYVLTNCHVVRTGDGFDKQKLTVEDYQGNTYTGYLYEGALSAEYDLAIIYFMTTETNVTPITLAKSDVERGEDVVLVGAPKGQQNYISFGKVDSYQKLTLEDADVNESNVKFDVICSNVVSDGGASGGALLNTSLELVGVNYAGTTTDPDSPQKRSYAIPVSRVREFVGGYIPPLKAE